MIILVGYNLLLWLLILLNNVVHFSLAIDRLKSADDAFRRQLEDKVQAFQEQITELEHDKQVEVDQANLRVRELTIYFWGLDTQKIAEIILKFDLCGFTIEKCVQTLQTAWQTADQDQIAPKRSWAGSTLFAQTCLSKYIRSLRYAITVGIEIRKVPFGPRTSHQR